MIGYERDAPLDEREGFVVPPLLMCEQPAPMPVIGCAQRKARLRMDLINVMLRDGSRKPLDVVVHAMNVEFEATERIAAFALAEALTDAGEDERAKRRPEATIYPDYKKAVDNASALLPFFHPKLANITMNEDAVSDEEMERSFNAFASKLDEIAAKL